MTKSEGRYDAWRVAVCSFPSLAFLAEASWQEPVEAVSRSPRRRGGRQEHTNERSRALVLAWCQDRKETPTRRAPEQELRPPQRRGAYARAFASLAFLGTCLLEKKQGGNVGRRGSRRDGGLSRRVNDQPQRSRRCSLLKLPRTAPGRDSPLTGAVCRPSCGVRASARPAASLGRRERRQFSAPLYLAAGGASLATW
jgi:hypothetical protein